MKIKMAILEHCPYCKRAARLIDEMKAENSKLADFEFEKIDEAVEGEKLSGLSYYYVPSFFYEGEKLYEASPGDEDDIMKPKLEKMFERLLEIKG